MTRLLIIAVLLLLTACGGGADLDDIEPDGRKSIPQQPEPEDAP